ncbi:MAG TPA: adenylate/guanylate cyclase domain-containing protein, partial [Chthonomonadales bacterium]|nr:adenylate/guanylate cyclase domain-containing protein [Chthonomonadales bacterium]
MDLPAGTVTFLFTDIQGSTRLWEEAPHRMSSALALHDRLLRQAIEERGGVVFKTVGDAFCAAFVSASQAIGSALQAQRALHRADWDERACITVRMAIHSGEAEQREGDYFGRPLNRVARLLAAAHGGQILLSQAALDLTGGNLHDLATVRDLGMHRLKDLGSAEQIYQVEHPELPCKFPPLRTVDGGICANNLPLQLTSFIGREKELREVTDLLRGSRLITLSGSGGCGKTRLGLQCAADLLERYPAGVWLVELAELSEG